MSVINLWAKHYQSAWEERGLDVRLPKWLRLVSYAYARHHRNGHANFRQGELEALLGVSASSVSQLISKAVDYGFLDPSSKARCLVVMPHQIGGGSCGSAFTPCTHHSRLFCVLPDLGRPSGTER